MGFELAASHRWTIGDALLYLVGVAGLAGSLTVLFLGMRAVLDVGGYCAEGGPYQIQVHCPDGALLMPLAIFAGLGSAALVGWKGASLGAQYAGVVALAWPALFMSLGWNFLEYGLWPPAPSTGIELGWLIPGVLFEIMGAVPLIAGLTAARGGRGATRRASGRTMFDSAAEGEARYGDELRRVRGRLLNDLVERADQRGATSVHAPGPPDVALPGADDDLVSKLERLAALHRAGALTYDEFERAKTALLAAQG